MTRPRVLFYCHNVFGLGHIVRSLRIAAACVNEQEAVCAVITGCRSLDELALPRGVHIQRLPPVRRDSNGALTIDRRDMTLLVERGRRILDFARAWQPDVFVADHNPLGLGGELIELLTAIRCETWPIRVIWGVPYVKGIPHARSPRARAALETYDTAIAYTDGAVEPILDALDLPATIQRQPPGTFHATYAGFITEQLSLAEPSQPPLITALCGGGAEAENLGRVFMDALARFPNVRGRFVAGPLACDAVHAALRGTSIETLRTSSLEDAVREATIVVSRAGYNSSYALAATELPLVLAPVPLEGSDQQERAARLRGLDGIWTIDECLPSATDDLTHALQAALQRGRAPRPLSFRVDGASRAAELISMREP
jgi:predicted glycosyltransferase